MYLNFQNVEEIVFKDKNVQNILPEFKHLFDSWTLSIRITALRNLGKRSLLDFLNSLSAKHLQVLSNYFKQDVKVERLDYNIVRNINTTLDGAVEELSKYEGFLDLAISRKDNQLYICMWK